MSDFTGLFALSLFLGIVIPRRKKIVVYIVGVAFIVWKTPIVTDAIKVLNDMTGIHMSRTIDYSDYIALFVLPIAYLILAKTNVYEFRSNIQKYSHPCITNTILLFCFLVFCSTSISEPNYPKGDILINKEFDVQKSKEEVLNSLIEEGLVVSIDSIRYSEDRISNHNLYYQIKQLEIRDGNLTDTCYNINIDIYTMNGNSTIFIINLSIKDDWKLQDWKVLKEQTELYEELVLEKIAFIVRDK